MEKVESINALKTFSLRFFFAAAADLVKRDNIVRFFFAAGADFGSNDCSPHSRSGSGAYSINLA